MKIAFCPLVSRDMDKAIRATNSCRNQFSTESIEIETVAIINSQNQEFVSHFSEWCEKENVKYKVTESNGTPSKGKNSVLDFLQNSEYDGLSLTDGDDLFYPTGAIQIEKHMRHHPGTDVLIVKPSDQVLNEQTNGSNQIGENKYAVCWGMNIINLGYKYGPEKHDIFTLGHKAARNLGGHVFYSKKLSNMIRYDEEQLLGEDLLLEFNLLKLHQESKISFWLSFASDVQMLDRTNQESIQKTKNSSFGSVCYERLIEKVREILPEDRSSFNELPVEFPEIIFNYDQKIEWLKQVF
jgi:hypothetical protein